MELVRPAKTFETVLPGTKVSQRPYVGDLLLCHILTIKGRNIMTAFPMRAASPLDQLAIGVKEAARLVGLSHWAIRQYIRLGKLRAVRIGRRVLIEPAELQRLVVRGRTEAQ
jgi:excisionase family DNA binding protein